MSKTRSIISEEVRALLQKVKKQSDQDKEPFIPDKNQFEWGLHEDEETKDYGSIAYFAHKLNDKTFRDNYVFGYMGHLFKKINLAQYQPNSADKVLKATREFYEFVKLYGMEHHLGLDISPRKTKKRKDTEK